MPTYLAGYDGISRHDAGTLTWNKQVQSRRYTSVAAYCEPAGVFVYGYAYEDGTAVDGYAVHLYNSSGLVWRTYLDAPFSGYSPGLSSDAEGSVYLGQFTTGPFAPKVSKYDSLGAKVWDAPLSERASVIEIDDDGTLYASGIGTGYAVHRVNADGSPGWTVQTGRGVATYNLAPTASGIYVAESAGGPLARFAKADGSLTEVASSADVYSNMRADADGQLHSINGGTAYVVSDTGVTVTSGANSAGSIFYLDRNKAYFGNNALPATHNGKPLGSTRAHTLLPDGSHVAYYGDNGSDADYLVAFDPSSYSVLWEVEVYFDAPDEIRLTPYGGHYPYHW